jgi:hypothetical protein
LHSTALEAEVIRVNELGAGQIRARQVHVLHVGAVETGAAQRAASQIHPGAAPIQRREFQVDAVELPPP